MTMGMITVIRTGILMAGMATRILR